MSAFLTRLAGIALGAPAAGAARLSLPPRYAQPRAGDAGFEAVHAEEALAGPLLPPERVAEPATPAGERAPDAAPPEPVAAPAERQAAPAFVPPIVRDAGEARPPKLPSRPLDAPHAAPPLPVPPVPVPVPVPDRAAAPSAVPPPAPFPRPVIAGERPLPPAPAAAPPGEIRIAEAEPDAPPRLLPQPDPPQRAARERRTAPLSERALIGRTERPRQAEPVIHVTIDRIDVRAPASPHPAPAARRRPAEPSVSLSDFLRGGGPRTGR